MVAQRARSKPARPPKRASTRFSVNNCRTNRQRLAPNAKRTATSLFRAVARASKRLARLTQAMSITTPTSPISKARNPTTCPWGKRPGRRVLLSGNNARPRGLPWSLVHSFGYCCCNWDAITVNLACACGNETPDRKRPNTASQRFPRFLNTSFSPDSLSFIASGTNKST